MPSKITARSQDRTHRVVMLGYPDAQMLDITGPLEAFARSSRLLRDRGISRVPAYSVELVGLKPGPFATSSGVQLVAERSYKDITTADTLLIAGGMGCFKVMEDEGVLRWIRRLAPRVIRLGSVCNGALILAKTGLLNGRSATTHWDDIDHLLRLGPSVHVQPDAIYVRDGNIYTSAGITAGIDMALAMVEEDWGQPVALATAQMLVMFLKRPGGQSQFSAQLAAQFSEDDKLRELQLWMLEHLQQDLSIPKLASRVAMSERNFARRFTASVGMTPAAYVSKIRLEAARRKLEENDLQVSQVARRCGFGTQETMRRCFIAELGIPPSDYRERFRGATT
ncbi:MAG TPA: GlxA family transcriptional regulator [Gammaproteobacteria bacterium]|nr:GlxA family transcriptional regulator [Gammaproteobacteria bacterium]